MASLSESHLTKTHQEFLRHSNSPKQTLGWNWSRHTQAAWHTYENSKYKENMHHIPPKPKSIFKRFLKGYVDPLPFLWSVSMICVESDEHLGAPQNCNACSDVGVESTGCLHHVLQQGFPSRQVARLTLEDWVGDPLTRHPPILSRNSQGPFIREP